MNQYLELGQIVNVKGLKGEVKVNSFSENNERFEEVSEVILKLKSKQETYKIEKVGYHKSQVIIKFKNVNTVEEAEKLSKPVLFMAGTKDKIVDAYVVGKGGRNEYATIYEWHIQKYAHRQRNYRKL